MRICACSAGERAQRMDRVGSPVIHTIIRDRSYRPKSECEHRRGRKRKGTSHRISSTEPSGPSLSDPDVLRIPRCHEHAACRPVDLRASPPTRPSRTSPLCRKNTRSGSAMAPCGYQRSRLCGPLVLKGKAYSGDSLPCWCVCK